MVLICFILPEGCEGLCGSKFLRPESRSRISIRRKMEVIHSMDRSMAHKSRVNDLLQLASASRTRSAVALAAISFAICHLVAQGTGAADNGRLSDDLEITRQLTHFAAELCRFVLPLGFLAAGFTGRPKN